MVVQASEIVEIVKRAYRTRAEKLLQDLVDYSRNSEIDPLSSTEAFDKRSRNIISAAEEGRLNLNYYQDEIGSARKNLEKRLNEYKARKSEEAEKLLENAKGSAISGNVAETRVLIDGYLEFCIANGLAPPEYRNQVEDLLREFGKRD